MKLQTKQFVKLTTTREDKALQLFQAGAVSKSKKSDDLYYIKSQKNPSIELATRHRERNEKKRNMWMDNRFLF